MTPEPSSSLPTQDVLLELIHDDPGQPRKLFDEETLKAFAEELWSDGLLHPIHVEPDLELAGYRTKTGARRVRAFGINRAEAARLLELDPKLPQSHPARLYKNWTVIPAVIDQNPQPEWRRRLTQLAENHRREDLTLLETARCYAEAFAESGLNKTQFARLAQINPTELHNYIFLVKAIEGARGQLVLQALENQWLRDPDAVRTYAQLPADHQAALLRKARKTGNPISRGAVNAVMAEIDKAADRQQAAEGVTPRPRSPKKPTAPDPASVEPSAPRISLATVEWLQKRIDLVVEALTEDDSDYLYASELRDALHLAVAARSPYVAILETGGPSAS
jgi:ParB-like chromosome segregation protein Spo0J